MLDTTIPLWLVVTAVGVPSLCLLLLGLGLLRARRRRRQSAGISAAATASAGDSVRFGGVSESIHHEILEQQIDAVFDALSMVIDAERMKLKAMVKYAIPQAAVRPESVPQQRSVGAAEPAPMDAMDAMDDLDNLETSNQDEADLPLSEQVALLAEDGMDPEEIAYRLGLSAMEVSLALKMHARPAAGMGMGRRLEAVA
ncbi:MAG: hypothetical protein KFF50_17295 [Desulfatitalea sp.]|nr:hypothetical protein [Desulfatitalea sp.]